MFLKQRTLAREIPFEGIGLHTGYPVRLTLKPAEADSGVRFRRADLKDFEIEAARTHVAKVSYATTLMKKGVMISTVEHLLSALYGLGIDNVAISLNSMEVPILDGSGREFVRAIQEAGIAEQDRLRSYLVVHEAIEVRHDGKLAGVYPHAGQRATYMIDFPHAAIGRQELHLDLTPETYTREIASARTFGFAADVEYLRKSGLIRGGSLENAVVLDENGIVNGELRYPDEFVRHKLLDLLGDISLAGHPVVGHLYAEKAGHAIHTALADQIAKNPGKYHLATLPEISREAAGGARRAAASE